MTVDEQAFTYNKQYTLDGWVDINISFKDKQIYTTIYVKMEAPNQLLLSEAVCRQLGIIQYHPNVKPLDAEEKSETAKQTQKNIVRLVQTVRLPAQHTAVMPVKVEGNEGTLLLEPNPRLADLLCIEDSVLEATQESTAMVVVSNSSKMSHVLRRGEETGTVHKVSVVNPLDTNVNSHLQTVSFIELGRADEGSTNIVPVKDSGSPNVDPVNLPNELILAEDNEIPNVGEQVEDEQFSHEKQEWRKQQLKS